MGRRIGDYIGIIFGSVIVAIGLNALLIPNKIAAGGASGIATILYHIFKISPGIVLLAINVPLLIASSLIFGMRFGVYTIIGSLATSLAVELTQGIPLLTSDPLLAALYGGVVAGVGMGIVFRFRGSTGGTDIAAKFLSHYTGISIGQSLLAIDALVVIGAGIIFGAEFALYALIAIFVTTKLIDVVQEGFYSAKALFIVSGKADDIAHELMTRLDRGVTVFPSRGGFSKQDKSTLLCVVGRTELTRAKRLVLEVDRQAFIVVTDAHEVLGEGFRVE
ncbi:MAG: hypothetical protein FD169_2262 [Bacillota bacterium]|nr:MAG: hypothetical protein FD169_2262 [Bacillota bacterium]MBS3949645.1 YitT family protein [Peptococcaceae bacterium]